jgi:hypothetical protein
LKARTGSSRTTSWHEVLFPRTDGATGYHDITPRLGAALDVFGDDLLKTAHLQANNDAQYPSTPP